MTFFYTVKAGNWFPAHISCLRVWLLFLPVLVCPAISLLLTRFSFRKKKHISGLQSVNITRYFSFFIFRLIQNYSFTLAFESWVSGVRLFFHLCTNDLLSFLLFTSCNSFRNVSVSASLVRASNFIARVCNSICSSFGL